ncbi:MAG: HTH domain-containing protein [Erysipelotrichaceae bacterium]|nr:HTH domain-containing protein [Erysipelotrichaceae bacterium]
MTETGRLILSYLLAQDNTSISSRHLADLCNLSLSTIRNEINWLNDELLPYGIHIDSKQSQGCKLVIDDERLSGQPFEQLKYDLKRKLFNTKSKTYRSDYILRRLLLSSGYITQEKLSEELFFSPSTVNRSITLAQQGIKRYGLEIKLKKNHGLYVSGDEFSKRVQMLILHKKYMHLDPLKKGQEKKYADYFLTGSDQYRIIKTKIVEILSKYKEYEFSFINTPKLVNYLILCKQRHTYTKSISFTNKQLELIHADIAYIISKEIFESLKSFFDFTLTENDYCSFARLMMGYRSISSIDQIQPARREHSLNKGAEILNELIQAENLDPELFTSEIYEQFSCNLETIYLRRIMGTPFDMESFYPLYGVSGLSADFCITLTKIIEKHYQITLDQTYSKSNLYLFERIFDHANKSSMNLKIVVISLYGKEYARNVAGYLGRKYKRYIQTIDASEYTRINELSEDIDLILTDLSYAMFQNKKALSLDFSNGSLLCSGFENFLRKRVIDNMTERLGNSIHKTKFKTKKDVFEFIADTYQNEFSSKEQFIKDLNQRDEIYSSSRKNNMAFISTYNETLPESTFMILINHNDIDWNGSKVKYFIFYYRNRNNQNDVYTFMRILNNLIEKTPAELEELFSDTNNIIHSLAPNRFI